MPKPVAIILLNWNTPVHTANCVSSLLQYCDKVLFDIVIADNGSTDGSLTILQKQFPNLIYIDNAENLGFAEGNNRALVYSMEQGYTYSLVINTDTLVDEDIITELSTHLNCHAEAAAVQPAIYWMHDKTRVWNGKGRFNRLTGVLSSDRAIRQKPAGFEIADWLTGCCMMIRNSALEKSGLFSKPFFLYYEDVDLSFRLRYAGYELHYLPSSKMYHEAGVSAKIETPKKKGFLNSVIHYYTVRNRIWILRRYGWPVCYPFYIFSSGIYYISLWVYFKIRSRNEKASFLIKGLKDGLFTPKSLIWH